MKRIYLDHNATTKIRKEVFDESLPYFNDVFGNPSSLHFFGQKAHAAVSQARHRVSDLIGARPDEIVFTSSGTEANNLAVIGFALRNVNMGNHIITSSVEHYSVLECIQYLEKKGFRVTYLPVDQDGMIDPESVRKAVSEETILISIMLANNEVGTILPVKEIAEIGQIHGICVHTDAVQAAGKIKVNVKDLQVDMLSLSAHKLYGPKGTGALYIRKGKKIDSLILGGHQEKRRRSGTENVPGIVGLGKACELANSELEASASHVSSLRNRLEKKIMENIEDVKVNGHLDKRVPNTLNISFGDIEGEAILINLDLMGIAVSTGSACTTGAVESSHVLMAMGLNPADVRGAIRFSLGIENTEAEIDFTISCLKDIVSELRKMTPSKI